MDEIQTGDKINLIDFKTLMQSIFEECSVFINFFSYNPSDYIKKTKMLEIPHYISNRKHWAFRILSMHYGLSLLSKLIYDHIIKEKKVYDTIILTRFDIFPSIKSFGCCLTETKETRVYLWRTCPYVSFTDAEDRLLILNMRGLEKLKSLYNIYDNLDSYNKFSIDTKDFYSEHILGKYFSSFNDLLILPQTKIIIGISPYINVKSSNYEYFTKLIKDCEESSCIKN
jgi:hypothetical protein